MRNSNQQKNLFKKPLILFIIALVLVFASSFGIWFLVKEFQRNQDLSYVNFIGWAVYVLLTLLPVASLTLLIVSVCITLKVVFKTKEHPIKNSFIAHLVALIGIVFVVVLMLQIGSILSFTELSYLVWLIYSLTVLSLLTVFCVICIVKFIIELVKDWMLVRTAILETRTILENRINKQ